MPVHTLSRAGDLGPLLKRYAPELVFVSGWYWIIPEALLSLPHLSFVGFHFSLLPQYRGCAPVVWAMINGEKECGLSLFRFDAGVDSGPIYIQDTVKILDHDYINDVLDKLENKSLQIISDNFLDILKDKATVTPQKEEGKTYAAPRLPEDGQIDWKWPQKRIYNFIRAQGKPYPGAYAMLGDKKMYVWRAYPENDIYFATPGQVIAFKNGMALVACGDNKALWLQDVEVEGEQHRSPKEALKSIKNRLSK